MFFIRIIKKNNLILVLTSDASIIQRVGNAKDVLIFTMTHRGVGHLLIMCMNARVSLNSVINSTCESLLLPSEIMPVRILCQRI